VVVNSLSKTYAMTGWRVGYCAGPETIIQAMFLVLQQCSRGPATFVQDAATDPLLDAVRLHPGTHLLSTLPVIFFTAASSISPYRSANAFLMALTTMSA
jgi:hypothetical protein